MGKGRGDEEEEGDEEEGSIERSWTQEGGKRGGYGGRPLRPRGLYRGRKDKDVW